MFLWGRPSKALRLSKVSSLIKSYNPLSSTVQRLAAILARLLLASTNKTSRTKETTKVTPMLWRCFLVICSAHDDAFREK